MELSDLPKASSFKLNNVVFCLHGPLTSMSGCHVRACVTRPEDNGYTPRMGEQSKFSVANRILVSENDKTVHIQNYRFQALSIVF